MTIMAVFGLLSFEGFDALLLRVNGHDGLFEPFAQVLIRLVRLFEFFIFASQPFAQDYVLGPELFEFFILGHAPTVANYAMILQRHSPTEWLLFVLYIALCYTLLVEKIDMSKRDRCGSITTLEKCFGFAPTSQHRAAKYVGNLNMGPDKQETGSFRSKYPGGQMS